MFSGKTKKQKAKLFAIKGWVYRGEGAAARWGPLKVAAPTDITVDIPRKFFLKATTRLGLLFTNKKKATKEDH